MQSSATCSGTTALSPLTTELNGGRSVTGTYPMEEETAVFVYTWLDPQGTSYSYSYRSLWSLARPVHSTGGGHLYHRLVFDGGVCSRAAWCSSYYPKHHFHHKYSSWSYLYNIHPPAAAGPLRQAQMPPLSTRR
jgi:hypothetical protein